MIQLNKSATRSKSGVTLFLGLTAHFLSHSVEKTSFKPDPLHAIDRFEQNERRHLFSDKKGLKLRNGVQEKTKHAALGRQICDNSDSI